MVKYFRKNIAVINLTKFILYVYLSQERLDREGYDGLYVGEHVAHRREALNIAGHVFQE